MRASDKARWNINSIKVDNWSVTVSAITMAMPQKKISHGKSIIESSLFGDYSIFNWLQSIGATCAHDRTISSAVVGNVANQRLPLTSVVFLAPD